MKTIFRFRGLSLLLAAAAALLNSAHADVIVSLRTDGYGDGYSPAQVNQVSIPNPTTGNIVNPPLVTIAPVTNPYYPTLSNVPFAGADPTGLAYSSNGSTLYVAAYGFNEILKYSSQGTYEGVFADASSATNVVGATALNGPAAMRVGPSGDLYVTNLGYYDNNPMSPTYGEYTGTTVSVFSPNGTQLADFAQGLGGPDGIAFDAHGNAYVSEFNYSKSDVLQFGPSGGTSTATINNPNVAGPTGLTFDQNGNLLIANVYSGDVLEYNPTSPISSMLPLPTLVSGTDLSTANGGNGFYSTAVYQIDASHYLVGSAALGVIDEFTVGAQNPISTFADFSYLFGSPGAGNAVSVGDIVTVVPEPSSLVLTGLAMFCGLACVVRRRNRRDA